LKRIFFALGAVVLLALLGAHIRGRYSLCDQYDSRKLLGLTASEVEEKLGRPFHIEPGAGDGSAYWQYQVSMDPEALVSFENGRVVNVEFYYWRCPPFSDWFER
jgi:hypothetical protein